MGAAVRMGILLKCHQKGEQRLVRLALVCRVPQCGTAITGVGAVGVEIGLVEGEADAHVEHVADGAVAIGGAGCLRQQIGYRRIRIDQAIGFERRDDQGGERLADREDDVALVDTGMCRIVFGDDFPRLHQHEGVGMGIVEIGANIELAGEPFGKRLSEQVGSNGWPSGCSAVAAIGALGTTSSTWPKLKRLNGAVRQLSSVTALLSNP